MLFERGLTYKGGGFGLGAVGRVDVGEFAVVEAWRWERRLRSSPRPRWQYANGCRGAGRDVS